MAKELEITEGKALYEANCMSCHGEGARGDGPLAAGLPVKPANILEHLADHTDSEMVGRIKEGIPPVMPPASMSEEQIQRVLAYTWSLIPDSAQAILRSMQTGRWLDGDEGH